VAQRQLNIRVDGVKFDVLEAAAFIDGVSLPEIIRPVLDALANDLAADPTVQLALRAREERSATRSGKLTRLSPRQAEDV
jgi:hypothetical protein